MDLGGFFSRHRRVALAFSGGVDSTYLLYAGLSHGAEVHPFTVRSPFQPASELDEAVRLAADLGAPTRLIDVDVLADPVVAANPADRCYHCKSAILAAVGAAAAAEGVTLLVDGTNASDDADDRPGMRALRERGVRSPLRECGLTKADVRRLSRAAGLPTWDRPAYACLATRIPTGEPITPAKLAATEAAEELLASLGFSDVRVRRFGGAARIQLPEAQLARAIELRREIVAGLRHRYPAVLLDLEARHE